MEASAVLVNPQFTRDQKWLHICVFVSVSHGMANVDKMSRLYIEGKKGKEKKGKPNMSSFRDSFLASAYSLLSSTVTLIPHNVMTKFHLVIQSTAVYLLKHSILRREMVENLLIH